MLFALIAAAKLPATADDDDVKVLFHDSTSSSLWYALVGRKVSAFLVTFWGWFNSSYFTLGIKTALEGGAIRCGFEHHVMAGLVHGSAKFRLRYRLWRQMTLP